MAERITKRKTFGRSASTESTEYSLTMGRSSREKKVKKPRERWLLTRKTWRYMADAGKKLIPDGAQNRLEDIPKIEAYFQEVCRKEPRFLLWRKNSFPGAMGLRKKVKSRRKGGSCRNASSADEAEFIKPVRPKDLAISPILETRFNIQQMKTDFLNKPPTPTNYLPSVADEDAFTSSESALTSEEHEERQLITMLEQYLKLADEEKHDTVTKPSRGNISESNTAPYRIRQSEFNYQELIDKLQRHLTLVNRNLPTTSSSSSYVPRATQVHFEGDHVQKSVYETLNRYFSHNTNRNKIVSDLLTDRKTLEKLYYELRKTKGFRGSRGGTGYTSAYGTNNNNSSSRNFPSQTSLKSVPKTRSNPERTYPPPLIEIQSDTIEITYHNWGTQTLPILESVLRKLEDEFRRAQAERDEEERRENRVMRRRSSVDNDDVSQSVSDTIKRYLRMARKKSVDTDKAEKFKRVNYDRNLRNIKAKGEITKPGDDDGLNKGCQTNDDWIVTYRDLKFTEVYDLSDNESRVSSARSSIDIGVVDEQSNKSYPSSPVTPTKSSSQSFLSHFLHSGKHDKSVSAAAAANTASSGAMQKSKSSSSVMHHGRGLMAKKIFRSRSKSQTRPSQATCSWTPQGNCLWTNVTGKQVVLNDTTLLQLSEIERKVLQKVAIAKLQALNLGVAVKVPTENIGAVVTKPKRRPYLLKRKALTTSIFDTSRKDSEKEGSTSGGLVFGIPLTQCVENDKLSRAALGTSPFRSRGDLTGSNEESTNMGRHGSRSSFSSLIDAPRGDESGSCESLLARDRIVGSVPGLLDTLSCGSISDIPGTTVDEEIAVPNILNECFRHLEQHGLHTLGIFRVSTSRKRIRQLREDFDTGKETALDEEQCPHDVATLLKEYLRDLPDPLLCRDLYNGFVQTQRIRNRRLQFEALQHLIQLLPPPNRDTLYSLLTFLEVVARHSEDSHTGSGNKMDSNNLATVFAPNILHCIKPGSSKDGSGDRPEDRIDVINVVRTLIDHYKQLYSIPAELLDEVYVHMMDSHPEALDVLLMKREAVNAADESVEELDSESYSAPWTPTAPNVDFDALQNADSDGRGTPTEPKKTYSREEFLHETAATGGPNIGMRIRHKDRIRERSRRKREESATRKKKDEDSGSIGSGITSAMTIISRLRGNKDDEYSYGKNRSSSLESTSSAHTDTDVNKVMRIADDVPERRKSSPYLLDNRGVITASLTIPVQTTGNQGLGNYLDDDIPYIEEAENGRQQLTIGLVRTPTAPPRRRQRSISGSDSSVASTIHQVTGAISVGQGGYDSAVGSSLTHSSPVQNTPTSVSSSIADAGTYSSPPSWASSPPTSPDSTHTSVNYIPDEAPQPKSTLKKTSSSNTNNDSPTLQRVSFSSVHDVQQSKQPSKDVSAKSSYSRQPSFSEDKPREREPKFTPSITSIGNAVLRSKTADFERKVDSKPKNTTATTTSTTSNLADKKKYTKRRYTDSRHQTRHIPDSETLNSASSQAKKDDKASAVQTVYKRRELISSVPSK